MPTDETPSHAGIMGRMRRLEIRTRRMVNDTFGGAYHSVFKGRGMDFSEVREYSPGDEVRSIDWNVTARAGRAFVKQFTEERELTIFLLVDISASGNFGSGALSKRELAAEIASLLAFSAIRNNDKVGLLLYTDRVERYLKPKKGRHHVLRVVRDILYHSPEATGTDSVKALDVASHVLHRRAIVFLISDFEFAGDQAAGRAALRRALRQVNRRHDLIAVHIEDPRERELPDVGILAVKSSSSTPRARACARPSRPRPRSAPGNSSMPFARKASTPCSCKPTLPTSRPCSASSRIEFAGAHEHARRLAPRLGRGGVLRMAGMRDRRRAEPGRGYS
jgi:uncharacterized protein (DUF58 family)